MNPAAARSEPAQPSSSPTLSWAPWLVLGLALAIRWVYYSQVHGLILFGEATGDAAQYVSLAESVARDGLLAPRGQAYFQAPLYPWYLALVQAVGGSLTTARIVQFLAGALGALLAWDTGRRIAGPRAGLVAGILAALYAPRLFFEGELLSIAWALTLLQLSVWSLAVHVQTGRGWAAPLAGCSAGLAALAQPNAALVIPCAAVWLYLSGRRSEAPAAHRSAGAAAPHRAADGTPAPHHAADGTPAPHRAADGTPAPLRTAGLYIAAALVVILPVLARNRAESGDWVLISSNAGINFFIGNNPDADGTFHLPAGEPLLNSTEGLSASASEAASRALGRAAGPSETSSYWLRRGLAWWGSSPLQAVGLTARKTLFFLNGVELPNHYDITFFRESVPLLRILPGFFLVAPLALWGLFRLARRRSQGWLLVIALAYAVSVILFFVTDRYRLPVLAVFLPAAGAGLSDVVEIARRRRAAEIVPVAATLLLLFVLAGFRFVDTRPGLAHMHNLVGTLHYRRDNLGAARQEFERALQLDPSSAEAMNNLGRVALLANRSSEAEEWFEKAAATDPRLVEAYFNLEELERNRGRWAEGLKILSRLESSLPGAASAWAPAIAYRRGLLHQAQGDSTRARQELSRAVALKPDLAGAWEALGVLDLSAGELKSARQSLTRAVALAPEAYVSQYNLGLVAERQGDYSAALASYAEARRLAPEKTQPAYHAARVLEALGQKEEALQVYRQALQIGGTGVEMKEIEERIAALEGRLP